MYFSVSEFEFDILLCEASRLYVRTEVKEGRATFRCRVSNLASSFPLFRQVSGTLSWVSWLRSQPLVQIQSISSTGEVEGSLIL